MFIYVIPLVIVGASLIGILVVVVRHFADLIVINVESIPEEKEGRVRDRLIIEKLQRRVRTLQHTISTVWKPLQETLVNWMQDAHQALLTIEKRWRDKTQPLSQIDVRAKVRDKLVEAALFKADGKTSEAENAYIEAISLEHRNPDAYEPLIEIYLEQREYRKARETGRHVIKLLAKSKGEGAVHRLASNYAQLGSIYRLEDKDILALRNVQKAVELEPSNPRFLDLLLKISIMLKRKDVAGEAFLALQQADPENQKLFELAKEIEQLPDIEA